MHSFEYFVKLFFLKNELYMVRSGSVTPDSYSNVFTAELASIYPYSLECWSPQYILFTEIFRRSYPKKKSYIIADQNSIVSFLEFGPDAYSGIRGGGKLPRKLISGVVVALISGSTVQLQPIEKNFRNENT